MGQISSKLRSIGFESGRGVGWWCPGCEELHAVSLDGPMRPGATGCGPWTWNGDGERPSFTPSVNVHSSGRAALIEELKAAGRYDPARPVSGRCHTVITAGVINFLSDCEHPLAGQAVLMPPLPGWLRDGWEGEPLA